MKRCAFHLALAATWASFVMLAASAAPAPKPLSIEQLARLKDIGSGTPTIDVSPDGKAVVFQVVEPDPQANRYSRGWHVLRLDGKSAPSFLMEAGQPTLRRSADVIYGVLEESRAQWSADSLRFAILVNTFAGADLWIAARDGSGLTKLGKFDTHELEFQWAPDGTQIHIRTLRDHATEREIDSQGARRGYVFDDRFRPDHDISRPLVVACGDDDQTGRQTAASQWERMQVCNERHWVIDVVSGSRRALARGELNAWQNTRSWNASPTEPGRNTLSPGSIAELLSDCRKAGVDLICVREAATQPQQIVRVSAGTGESTLLFDPNPQLHEVRWGKVKRLHWAREPGLSAFADLVYPVGYDPAKQYPLIVVQYRSRGFLRGGTGDEYPIHAFSANGFFVLSFDTTIDSRQDSQASAEEHEAADWHELAERKREFDGLIALLDQAQTMASIDASRVGITGLSDGAETLGYSLIHSTRFAAAAASDAFWGPLAMELLNNPLREYVRKNLGAIPGAGTAVLAELSVGMRAREIQTPILYQVADREMLPTLYNYRHLEDAKAPVEMVVFPDEYHVKWQPAHRLAVYRRNLQWFAFWLQQRELGEPMDPQQYERWRGLEKSLNLWRQTHASSNR